MIDERDREQEFYDWEEEQAHLASEDAKAIADAEAETGGIMNNPTKEQIQWFWAQCDIEVAQYSDGVWWERIGEGRSLAHPIDLNNLFKWAMPKALDCLTTVMFEDMSLTKAREALFRLWLKYWDEDEALALFWACYKVLVKEELNV